MKTKPVHLPHGKTDHSHTCAQCGTVWHCRLYTLKECRTKGVFKAAQVNGTGPFCIDCLNLEMARRGYKGSRWL